MSTVESYNMKKFMKDCIKLYENIQEPEFDELFAGFSEDSFDVLYSFDTMVQRFSSQPFMFDAKDGKITAVSKNENAYQIRASFYKDKEDMGDANLMLVMRKPSKIFNKLFENNNELFGIYFIDHKIGILYFTKKGKLDFHIEENTVENILIRSVTVDIEKIIS